MLAPVVDALHALRADAADTPIGDTRLAVAALRQALVTELRYGATFRRSAGIAGPVAEVGNSRDTAGCRQTPNPRRRRVTVQRCAEVFPGGRVAWQLIVHNRHYGFRAIV